MMNLGLVIEKLNKIKDVKGKLKYLEQLIFKTKNGKIKKELIKLLKKIQKSGKKQFSFEEIHENKQEEEKKPIALEEIVVRRSERFGTSELELKDYLIEAPEEITTTPIELPTATKKDEYIPVETYKPIEERKDYIPLEFESEYKRMESG